MADFDPVSFALGAASAKGGPGGASTLSGLTDVDISNPANGQTLVYNATSGKWENGAGGGVAVVGYSFDADYGRTTCDKTAAEIYDLFDEHGSVVLSDGVGIRTVIAYDYDNSDPGDFLFGMLVVGVTGTVVKFTAETPNDYPYASELI